ncbi:hypothetical protein [Pseudoduganella armeniaca]|nr:hypothetical protein [Pseudoduganella armeniaca]
MTQTWQFQMAAVLGYVSVLVLTLIACAEEAGLAGGVALPL